MPQSVDDKLSNYEFFKNKFHSIPHAGLQKKKRISLKYSLWSRSTDRAYGSITLSKMPMTSILKECKKINNKIPEFQS